MSVPYCEAIGTHRSSTYTDFGCPQRCPASRFPYDSYRAVGRYGKRHLLLDGITSMPVSCHVLINRNNRSKRQALSEAKSGFAVINTPVRLATSSATSTRGRLINATRGELIRGHCIAMPAITATSVGYHSRQRHLNQCNTILFSAHPQRRSRCPFTTVISSCASRRPRSRLACATGAI